MRFVLHRNATLKKRVNLVPYYTVHHLFSTRLPYTSLLGSSPLKEQ